MTSPNTPPMSNEEKLETRDEVETAESVPVSAPAKSSGEPTKGDGAARNRNLLLILGAIAVVIAGGALLFTQTSSGKGCVGEGPCMLYFYTDD